jgi:hypothetical protein
VQANSAPEKIAVKRSVLDARCAQNCNGAMTIPSYVGATRCRV